MGHRRNRKLDRRADSGPGRDRVRTRDRHGGHDAAFLAFEPADAVAPPLPAATCGNCREFIEDPNAGRGECLHPGSGILMPWSDTPPCAFHAPRGRR